MKKILPLLLLTCASTQAQTHSPELTQLLSEIHEQYNSPSLMSIDKKDMADVTKLPYFLQHIDETDTVESIRLNAYLQGLQTAYFRSNYRSSSFFCMPWGGNKIDLDPNNNPNFTRDIIWRSLERITKNEPQSFRKANYAPSFAVSTSSLLEYGLQIEFPCQEPIPKSKRKTRWKY
ncbi:hypothetical protein [Vibrio harveyi]|uniref:hypothetical protein n=1 Tax=Vibrio harveyi TaxID=669 RepID=UPI000C7CF41D|nr:hypothetical protein [Vibrio harveyi]